MSIYEKLKSPEFYSYVRLKVKNHLSNVYYVGKTSSKENYKYQESWKLEKINDFTHDIYCNLLDLKNENSKLFKKFNEKDYDSLFEKYKHKIFGHEKKLPSLELDAYLTTSIKNFIKDEKKKEEIRSLSFIERLYKKIERLILNKQYHVATFLKTSTLPANYYFKYDTEYKKSIPWEYKKVNKVNMNDILVLEKKLFESLVKSKAVISNKKIERKVLKDEFLPRVHLNRFESDNDDWVKEIPSEDYTEKNKFELQSEIFKKIFSQKINFLLDEIITTLGGRCEQLFNLHKLDYTDKEKSEIMRIPIGSIKSAFNNCKKKAYEMFKLRGIENRN